MKDLELFPQETKRNYKLEEMVGLLFPLRVRAFKGRMVVQGQKVLGRILPFYDFSLIK